MRLKDILAFIVFTILLLLLAAVAVEADIPTYGITLRDLIGVSMFLTILTALRDLEGE